MKNGKLDAKCGSRVWIDTNHPLNKSLRIPGEGQLNQVGKLAAVIEAVEILPNYHKLTIITDSRYVSQTHIFSLIFLYFIWIYLVKYKCLSPYH